MRVGTDGARLALLVIHPDGRRCSVTQALRPPRGGTQLASPRVLLRRAPSRRAPAEKPMRIRPISGDFSRLGPVLERGQALRWVAGVGISGASRSVPSAAFAPD